MEQLLNQILQSVNNLESKVDILASKIDQLDFDTKCITALISEEINN